MGHNGRVWGGGVGKAGSAHRRWTACDCAGAHPGTAYWQGFDTYHSVVVVGYDATHVYVNDPHFDNAPMQIAKDDLWLA
ncbi:MAG: hypothetical protein DRI80_09285 [Chloroflexota bacterium]|nr:MAG: hypothetical protein DRI80_09285 [Chloroflexota bacterium]